MQQTNRKLLFFTIVSTALSLGCAEANENDGADATPGDTAGESDEMGASGDEVEGTGETGGE
ncbi:MAG: hypothetical protein KC431_07260, partial [Myxococcales bacterium]|nr:hypothetical protein [Myxococcales bacterium]